MGKNDEKYYTCDYLLTLKDVDGLLPDTYIVDGNRTAGKSVAFKKRLIDTYLKDPTGVSQFVYIIRNKGDLQGIENAIFDDVSRLFYNDHTMQGRYILNKNVVELRLDNDKSKICGFAVALSMARKIKNFSGVFVRVKHGFFDEYQDEENTYLTDEINKFLSLRTSIARGDGEQSRRVPIYMASNTISMLNPYYSYLGIDKMIKSNTKFLKGHGWVYERTFNESANKAMQNSGMARAFGKTGYFAFAGQNVYLNDNLALIAKPEGQGKYMLTVKYNGEWFSVWKYPSCIYCREGANMEYPTRICFTVNDMTDDRAMMIGSNNALVVYLREYFNRGFMRFQNINCKNMCLDLLNYI